MRDTADAFAGGDYLSVARHASQDTWQYWASLGLMGHPANAASELERFGGADAAFVSGVASWIAGDDDRARGVLGQCEGEHARRLHSLISRRPITVLGQLPWNRSGSWDVLTQLHDPAFRVFNVSFHPDDVQNRPYADARTLVPDGVQADFFVAEMVEWHLIPPNVRALGCPVIGHSSDFDLHIQAVVPWLDLFDELVVLDHVEWRGMRRLVRVPVTTFPKVFGVPARLPALQIRERDVDVFLSGTIAHPYHSDKDPIVLDTLRVPDICLRIVQGFEKADAYYRNLSASKISCTFVRHPGAMPTRGLEALAMGCAVVVQEESALRLFVGETEGVVPYRAEDGDLAAAIQTVLSRWDDYSGRALRGADIVRREFALDRVASQYLRFLTFLAARPRETRPGPPPHRLVQKRPVVRRGWLPSYRFGSGILMDWASASEARIENLLGVEETASLLNDLAREHLLSHYHDDRRSEWLGTVLSPLERAIDRFPAALVPRFNLIRVLLHFGSAEQVRRGVTLIDDTIARPVDHWQVDPLDDVLPWDFCPSWFNYRRYFDTVTRSIPFSAEARSTLIAVILASLNHYRARYVDEIPSEHGDIGLAAAAVRLDPEFAEYVLWYCRLLIDRAGSEDLAEAQVHLARLAQRSTRLLEILDLARRLPHDLQGPWYVELQEMAARFWNATSIRDHLPEPVLRSSRPAVSRRGPAGEVA
jgi:hypothetical protein